ncbi:MAG TPA: T9SS type A sorting domain-containing protein [Cytophagaceae bacterium]|jgi:O-glycosyl hydrolase
MKIKLLLLVLMMNLTFTIKTFAQIEIVIDKKIKYQTIEGFGGFGAREVPWNDGGPLYTDQYIDKVINDLGLTISRTQVPTTFEMQNDNNDPFVTDLSKYNVDKSPDEVFGAGNGACKGEHRPLNSQTPWMSAMNDKAKAAGEPIKFIASIWSPPYWMKYVRCYFGADPIWNKLVVSEIASAEEVKDRKDEFAEYCVAFIKKVKEMTKSSANPNGIDLYAISLQNEPKFAQAGFSSATYSYAELANIIKHVGLRFDKEGIKTKIFWPEDIGDLADFRRYINAVELNPEITPHADFAAVHAYNANGTIAGSANIALWDGMYRSATRYRPIQFWQTETSGYYKVSELKDAEGKLIREPKILWGGGMNLATTMYVGLKYGKLSAWLYWSIGNSSNLNDGYQFFYNDQPNVNYIASKHFYRYIRPGAVQIDSKVSDLDVLPVAFQHDEKETMSMVIINQDSVNSKSIKLTFPAGTLPPASFKRYVSQSASLMDPMPTEKNVDKGTVSSTETISLPPNSITTLVGLGSKPVITETVSELGNTDAWSIFPNPAVNEINVNLNNGFSGTSNVEIFDVLSRPVQSVKLQFNNGSGTVNIESLSKGIYFIKTGNKTKQFVVAE